MSEKKKKYYNVNFKKNIFSSQRKQNGNLYTNKNGFLRLCRKTHYFIFKFLSAIIYSNSHPFCKASSSYSLVVEAAGAFNPAFPGDKN